MANLKPTFSDHPEKDQSGQPPQDAAAKEVQRTVDKAEAQGFYGVETDPTPNENYTVAGVTSGAPTPEIDPEQASKVGSGRFR